jgi:hypothetical protein
LAEILRLQRRERERRNLTQVEIEEDVPAVDRIMAELRSGYGGTAGPVKEVNELKLERATADGAHNKITARVVIGSFRQGLYDDMWNEEKLFDITLDDARFLEKNAPCFRSSFAQIAGRLSAQLREARDEYVSRVENWCDAGLPDRDFQAASVEIQEGTMTQEEYEALPIVERVMMELNSSYERCGASKEVRGVALVELVPNSSHATVARISVFSHERSPWGDTDDTRRLFEVPYDDIRVLAETPSQYSFSFREMSRQLAAQAEKDRAAREEWQKAGMPVQEPLVVNRPLRLKARP